MFRSLLPLALILLALAPCALSQELIRLIPESGAATSWKFNNGQEFPGATGSLTLDPEAERNGRPSLKLVGDFTGGGGYVQAGLRLDNVPVQELSLWVRSPETERFTLRLGDASGQTHQIVLKIEPGKDWQQVRLPLKEFFEKRGQADALTSVTRYQSWGGANDGQWHGPARGLYLLLSKGQENTVRNLWLSDINIQQPPMAVAGAEVSEDIRLDEIVEGIHDWEYNPGGEYPGAKGSLTVTDESPLEGESALKLSGDFTGGGAYVAVVRQMPELEAEAVPAIRMQVRSTSAKSVTIKLIDETGQTHQRKGIPIETDGQWHELALIPEEIAGGEHWGGANDGKWHGLPKRFAIALTTRSNSDSKKPELELAHVRAEAVLPSFAQPPAFWEDFEDGESASENWSVTQGEVSGGQLVLNRSLDKVNDPAEAIGPAFSARAGQWLAKLDCSAALESPDNSYNATVMLECLDGTGQVSKTLPVAELFGSHDTQSLEKVVELPAGTKSARFVARLNKTWGQFDMDNLSAAYLAPARPKDERIERMLFSTVQLGNLLFPEDSREVTVSVEARKPLRPDQLTLTYHLQDYWGAEQTQPATVLLGDPKREKNRFLYETKIDLTNAPLDAGRYYELHGSIPTEGDEAFRNHTSLAILPEAVTRQYEPEQVPFTSRNWDNRMPQFIRLTDRLGVRICGLWGGWSSKPPYKANAPGLELCQELGMGWLTTTPIKFIERGNEEYTEEALRQGVRNFLAAYGDARPLIINLGNEPHGTGERVRKNVEAYRIVYEEIKAVDPSVPVVATSVEPNEEYFANGYGNYCDAYDFHVYERYDKLSRVMGHYRDLMEEYDVVKPIWSTELGLNSEGQPRHNVSLEVLKKISTFFAEGGANFAWFGYVYPDADGSKSGNSGDSHNMFDCRFNRYCPRLDAITFYHAVNSVAIKSFAEKKSYPNGTEAFLFRDVEGRSLQVLWKENGAEDAFLPLAGVAGVELTRLDGRQASLDASSGEGLTLSIGNDPLLLTYEGGPDSLADDLGTPKATLNLPSPDATSIEVAHAGVSADQIALTAPPFWTVSKTSGNQSLQFALTPPSSSGVREVEVLVDLGASGQLYRRIPLTD